jgi:hypothetical protein
LKPLGRARTKTLGEEWWGSVERRETSVENSMKGAAVSTTAAFMLFQTSAPLT